MDGPAPVVVGRARAGDVRHVVADPASWVATLGEIATHVRSLGLAPRSIEPPVLDDDRI